MSVIVDVTTYRGITDVELTRHLPAAAIVNVHCRASQASARFAAGLARREH